ncbi:hypothetical protein AK830_g4480 [Neonectria ditissima]|uniref:Uncharacterized protein n=1 Tax=Neonectria ditissima TaxID=78410 RepID=A0A0P7BL83_9HYPO|nr:hypothetical protein AK830_g4480 [Neonectria ditissima]
MSALSSRGNVMRSAELEAHQKQRDEKHKAKESDESDSDDDDINYDSEDDTKELDKQTEQRRRQESHVAGYRQQMMKMTNGPQQIQIQHTRAPNSQGPWMNVTNHDDGDEDDIPLAMLQAHRQRDPMSRLAGVRSNPNLRGTAQQQFSRPGSSQSRPGSAQGQSHKFGSHLQLPSFARALPQDPFQDSFQDSFQVPYQNPFQDPISVGPNSSFQQPFSEGLIGVIASQERAKASRRGSPSGGSQPIPSPTNSAFGWTSGHGPNQNTQMASPYGMPGVQQPSRPQTANAAAQMQLQQMWHGLQAQSQFLQGTPLASQHKSSQSWNYFPSQSLAGKRGAAARDPGLAVPAYGGYAASIPPTERSTVGLPSRYRPVSRARS